MSFFCFLLSFLFRRNPAREEIVGFYSSGPKIKENDLKVFKFLFQSNSSVIAYFPFPKINALFRQYCAQDPVFVIIDVRLDVEGLPTTAYLAIEEVESDGREIQRVFKHVPCSIEAEEVEEVNVT